MYRNQVSVEEELVMRTIQISISWFCWWCNHFKYYETKGMEVYWPQHSKWDFANFSFTTLAYDCQWNKEFRLFVLECDEVTDASNKEQVIVCLRWVGSYLSSHEDFIGLHVVDNITTDIIVHVLKDRYYTLYKL